ncbi:Protein of unknown function [Lactobacillus helveticus CIRM-BIA 101]|nr:Protein of unknown function [Lactobacillus helveticus CIRM-BIA 101]
MEKYPSRKAIKTQTHTVKVYEIKTIYAFNR